MNSDDAYPALTSQNIQEEELNFSQLISIDKSIADSHLERSKIAFHDVLLSYTGEYRRALTYSNKKRLQLGPNICRIRSTGDINPFYLSVFLNSSIGQAILDREKSLSAQPTVAMSRIRQFKIPRYSEDFQTQIEDMITKRNKLKIDCDFLYSQAEQLLMDEIGIDVDEIDTGAVQVKSFSDTFVKTGRLDAEYYQGKYDELLKEMNKVQTCPLKDLVDINKSIEPGSDAYCEKGIPFVRIQDFSKEGIAETRQFLEKNGKYDIPELYLKKDTVLFSKDGTVGIAYKVPEDKKAITSGALLHLKVKDQSKLQPDYLALVLNSPLVQLQAERDAGGSIIKHWRLEEIKEIRIPVLPENIQWKISKLVKQSFETRAKSKQLLETAKHAVEVAIEEGEEVQNS